MATSVLLTIDTEMSCDLHRLGMPAADNLAISIFGRCDGREYGIAAKMDRMEAHGLRGVFFVDPMPALVFGPQIVADMIGPIVERGHEAQLHIHTEWLAHATHRPVDRTGHCIADYPLDEQIILLRLARQLLIDAGAPAPVAFRAGNYGANDDTLRALAAIGIAYDSSFNPAYVNSTCRISLSTAQQDPVDHLGVREIPISVIHQQPGTVRHAQLCALSAREMREALVHAAGQNACFFNLVSHSFELITRRHRLPNRIMIRRFERLCRLVDRHDGLRSAGFAALTQRNAHSAAQPLPADRMRTALRIGEQMLSRVMFEGVGRLPPLASFRRAATPF